MTIEEILQEIATLPAATQLLIAEKILERLSSDRLDLLSPEWVEVVQQRVLQIDAGIVQTTPADVILRQIRANLP